MQYVILNLGINDLRDTGGAATAQDVSETVKSLFVLEKYPRATVVFSEILHKLHAASLNGGIDTLNGKIEGYCDQPGQLRQPCKHPQQGRAVLGRYSHQWCAGNETIKSCYQPPAEDSESTAPFNRFESCGPTVALVGLIGNTIIFVVMRTSSSLWKSPVSVSMAALACAQPG